MKRWLAFAFALLMVSSSAYAKSSEEIRKDSYILIGVTPIGADLPTLLTSPLTASALESYGFKEVKSSPLATLGVYLGDSLLIGVDAGSLKASFEDTDTKSQGDVSYSNAGAYARWFMGNSFNILLGYHTRAWNLKGSTTQEDPKYPGTKLKINGAVDANASVGSVGIGNQWITDFGLTIGMDWLVASSVMGSTKKVALDGTATHPVLGSVSLATLSPATQQAGEKALNKLADDLNTYSGSSGGFILTLGMSF